MESISGRLKTVIIAPMTSTIKENFPTRVMTQFKDKKGQVALEKLRLIDRSRLVQKLGIIEKQSQNSILHILGILFQK
ncbi:MAG: type II toxin-antitoxin system PemK/MazF family toxin [Proteobacteria bacterium]|nr:type II toxin-antitoxin system PemK/MazF family toxin [Pseudomonadota bacterium]